LPFLVPGVGAQGGDLEGTLSAAGDNVLIHATRGVLDKDAKSEAVFKEGVRSRLLELNERIEAVRPRETSHG
ncbi:MAG: hypothetical protein AAGB34_10815, partial [Planctomycetota bacterium]